MFAVDPIQKRFCLIFFLFLFYQNTYAQIVDFDFETENLNHLSQSEEHRDVSLEQAFEAYIKQESDSTNQRFFFGGYNITGAYQSYITSDCHYLSLSRILHQPSVVMSDKTEALQSWVNKCQGELSRFTKGAIPNLVRFYGVKYPLSKNSHLRPVQFRYDNGKAVVRGILGLKDGQKRPLVIVKNGLYGEANEESVSKNFFMHLFDESPFHVLLLGNVTGKDFLVDNGLVALGGYDEGRQVHEVIDQILVNSEYKDLVEDVHMIGVSLGGNAALFSSLYSSYRAETINRLKSVTAVCPVVNLENSFNHVFSDSVVGIANGVYANNLVWNISGAVPILTDFLNASRYWTRSQISNAIAGSATQYYIERTQSAPWNYAPFENDIIHDRNEFWSKNNFLQYTDNISVPTLVLHSSDDPIVRDKDNAGPLASNLTGLKSQVAVVKFKHGGHCGYNVANGWPTMSTMLREHILEHSSYKVETKATRGDLIYKHNVTKEKAKLRGLKFVKYEWKAKENSKLADLKISYFEPNKRSLFFKVCDQDYRKADPSECFYTKTYKVHLSSFEHLNLHEPLDDYESNVLSRWLNTHVTPITDEGEYPYGQQVLPLKFYSHHH